MARRLCVLLVVGTVFFGCQLSAEELPVGAIARLGTTSLRCQQGVEGVAFSPDGKMVAGCGWRRFIHIWDAETGEQIQTLSPDGMSFAVLFSPDGKKLASSGDSVVRMYDLEKRELIFSKPNDQERTTGLAFSPDGLVLATGGGGETVVLWDAQTGDKMVELHTGNQGGDTHPVAFSPSGTVLASASEKSTIHVWNLATGTSGKINVANGQDSAAIAFLNESTFVISTSFYDRKTRKSGSVLSTYEVAEDSTIKHADDFVSQKATYDGETPFALTPNRERLVTLERSQLTIWDTNTRTVVSTIPRSKKYSYSRTHGIAVSPDGRLVACDWDSHKIHLFDLQTGEERLPQTNTHHSAVIAIDLSPDQSTIATSDQNGVVHLWDARTHKHIRRCKLSGNWVRDVRFFPDGKRFLAVGEHFDPDNGVQGFVGLGFIVNTADGTVVREIPLPDRGMKCAVIGDGATFAVALGLGDLFGFERDSKPAQIGIWKTHDDSEPKFFESGAGEIDHLVASADGKLTAVRSGLVTSWNATTGEKTNGSAAAKGRSPFTKTAFCPRDEFLLVGTHNYSRKPGESEGELLCKRLGEEQPTWSTTWTEARPTQIQLSTDGQLFSVFVSADSRSDQPSKLIVGHANDGKILHEFRLEVGNVRSLLFSKDNSKLYSGMDRGHVLVWNVTDTGN